MLDTLRANSRSVLTYVLFGIIIVVFVISFGPGSKGCSGGTGVGPSWAAKVNGETVTPTEFEQQYGQLLSIYKQQGLGELNALFQLQLRQMAMDQVVQRELVEQEARRQGLVVTDDEVSSAVVAIPAFQSNGQFDQELYRRSVTNVYGTPGKFEERMRRDLAYQKMLALLRGTAKVTDEEVKDAWLAENDKVSLELARFPFAAARNEVKPGEAEVKAFADASGPRIEAFYKDNPARFDKKKRVHARHVLVKVDEKAPQAEQDAARKKIDALAARLKQGEDFAKVAKEASDDPGSKDRGGDLGFFGPGVMAKAFEDAAFKLEPGHVSEPVRTQFGWHLIQVQEVQQPEVIPLDKARPEIARELLADELGKKLARARAQAALDRLKAGKTFAETFPADDKGAKGKAEPVKLGGEVVKAEETGLMSAGSSPSVPRVGPAPELFAAALAASGGQVLPGVYETAGAAVVARVKERQRPDQARFAEQRTEVESRLRLRREAEIERAWVEDLRKRSKVQTNEAFVQGGVRPSGPVELD